VAVRSGPALSSLLNVPDWPQTLAALIHLLSDYFSLRSWLPLVVGVVHPLQHASGPSSSLTNCKRYSRSRRRDSTSQSVYKAYKFMLIACGSGVKLTSEMIFVSVELCTVR